ncbi:MAG TPA: phytase [Polyangiaceae bacterium]|nr:phytase [Polyangiaceae bacterium]
MRGWAAGGLTALLLLGTVSVGCSETAGDDGAGGQGGDTPTGSAGSGGLSGLDRGDEAPVPDLPAVTPLVETVPVKGFGDAADDPAIWVHPTDPTKSLVFGTDKTPSGGLFVYDLDGSQHAFLQLGELNNVDLRSGFTLGERTVTLVTATNRTNDSLVVVALDEQTLELEEVSKGTIGTLPESYGLCMYRNADGKFFVYVNSTDGTFQQLELTAAGDEVEATLVRSFCVETQPEGCVVDDEQERLFVGEEGFGIWVFPAEADSPSTGSDLPLCESALAGTELDDTFSGVLTRDVEGMAIARTGETSGYLVVSAQGAHEFVLYDRNPPFEHVTTFAVWGGGPACIDGVEETDGLDVTSAPLGPDFPEGLLVVQDGYNGDPVDKQNFKFVSLADVFDLIEEPELEFVTNDECHLGDYGGKARFADLPPGAERTEAFCVEFCQKCADCYDEGDPGFSEGDCHYKNGKPLFVQQDCLDGCAAGANPADTRPLVSGWQDWACSALDDAL